MVYNPNENWGKLNVSFVSGHLLEIASELGKGFVFMFPLSTGTSSGPHLCRPWGSCHGLCEFISVSVLLCLGGLVPFVSKASLTLKNTSFPTGFLEPWRGMEFDGDNTFRTECSKAFHCLHIVQLWFSVSVSIYCR